MKAAEYWLERIWESLTGAVGASKPVVTISPGTTNGVVATSPNDVLDLTFSLDTSAYASGDLLADTQEIANFFRTPGGTVYVTDIVVQDADNQTGAMDIVFLDANQSLGTENSAPNISDANMAKILGHVPITAADYCGLGGCAVATVRGVNKMLKAAAGATSVWVAAISRDAKTYSAAGLKLKIGVQDYGIALARVASPAAIVPELGEELVSNGNMEAGDPPIGWSVSSAAISSVADERTGGSGSRSLGVARTEDGSARTYQVLSTSGATGRWYHLSAWLRNVDSSGGIRVYLSNLPGAEYATTGYVTATSWSNRILTTRATDVALLVRVMVNTSIAGQSGRADDISVKPLSLPSCLGSAITTAPEGIWECTPTLTTGTQAGMMLCIDDTANPANFILAYHDGTNAVLEKCVGGTYTTLVSAAATYSAGARLIVRKYGSEVTLFYNNAAVGVAQTVSDVGIVGNTKHALFSTYETNTFGTANGGFVHWPAHPVLPAGV